LLETDERLLVPDRLRVEDKFSECVGSSICLTCRRFKECTVLF
jgi:hypothetical protein